MRGNVWCLVAEIDADGSCYRMLLKTTDYLDHFARFKRKENVEAVERLLSAHKELAKFERAQLGMTLQSVAEPCGGNDRRK